MSYRSIGYKHSRTHSFNAFPPKRMNTNSKDFNLAPINWSQIKTEPFQRNFYKEHPDVQKISPEENFAFIKKKEITVTKNSPNAINSFDKCSLTPTILSTIKKLGFTDPTPIQCQSLPIVLSGHDMIGIAQTGSGKTLAFLIPALIHISAQKLTKPGDGPIALIVCPTRELALQIEVQISKFAYSEKISFCSIYGGAPRYQQLQNLRRGVDIVVATPGRLLDFISQKELNLFRTTYLVLDEADRMLDMGFERPIRQIIGQIRPDRQTLLFSATWPKEIRALASEFLTKPLQVNVGSLEISSCKNVEQSFEIVEEEGKMIKVLFYLRQLKKNEKVLIFCATKLMTGQLCYNLQSNGFNCDFISGSKRQFQRDDVIRRFKSGSINILIGTDVASRGIDIKDIMVVINYDFPNTIEDYVHRIGRTGRAKAFGNSYTLITRKNSSKVSELIKLLENDKKKVPENLRQFQANYCGGYRYNNNSNKRMNRNPYWNGGRYR